MTGARFTEAALRALAAREGLGRVEQVLQPGVAAINAARSPEPLLRMLAMTQGRPEPPAPGWPYCSYCSSPGADDSDLIYDGVRPQGWDSPEPQPEPSYAGYDPARVASALLRWHSGPLPHPISLAEARSRDLIGRLGTEDWTCRDEAGCQRRHGERFPDTQLTAEHFPPAIVALAEQAQDAREAEQDMLIALAGLKAAVRSDDVLALTAASTPPAPAPPAPADLTTVQLAGHDPWRNAMILAGMLPPPPQDVPAPPRTPDEPSPRRDRPRIRSTFKGEMRKR